MRLKSIRSTWVDIAHSYQDYAVKVQYLCEIASLSKDGDESRAQSRSFNHTKLIRTNEDPVKTSHGRGSGVGLKTNIIEGIRPKTVTVISD
ncbi:hypothetical protein M413DRAFT_446897 [Hebeloma cylindrosporum]|uniref:Uncharacterized protein n=1 Tax=Hebeloma cylindrosporum TaxID=76867 RepID=A0A0C2XQW2_HEBCY|nr:hypothetical protein M413DRAFT_446897 [Hebeloma cylindrosporum h7]